MSYLDSFIDELQKLSYIDKNKDVSKEYSNLPGAVRVGKPKDIANDLSKSQGSQFAPKEIQNLQNKPTYTATPKYSGTPKAPSVKVPGSIV